MTRLRLYQLNTNTYLTLDVEEPTESVMKMADASRRRKTFKNVETLSETLNIVQWAGAPV